MRFGIIGGGHAGVKAAETVQTAGHEAVIYSNENAPPYYRPKIIAYAFRQAKPEELLMHPQAWYAEHGIELRLETPVEAFNADAASILASGREETFDGVILTSGSGPFIPPVTQGEADRVLPLWNLADAERIAELAEEGLELVIIGGGILGIEAALRAVAIGIRVTVVERLPRLLPMQFGPNASPILQEVLNAKGIRVIAGGSVTSIRQEGQSVRLDLDGMDSLQAGLVLMSVGSRRNVQLPEQAGLHTDRGVLVDETLRASDGLVWAAGDIIQIPGLNRCSALDATIQGRLAAANMLAALTGGTPTPYKPSDAAVNYKFNDFEVHSVGRVAEEGDREDVVETDEKSCRIRVLDGAGKTVGVQMVGTGLDFKKWAAELV